MEDQRTVTATLRYLHIAPRKARFLADIIRGLSVNEAEAQLLVSPRRPADPLLKLLRSAIANAHNNFKMAENNLFIQEMRVDEGPTTKRWMPRARGGTSAIAKRTSHVTLVLGTHGTAPKKSFTIIRPEPKKETKHKLPKQKQPPPLEEKPTREHRGEEHGYEEKPGGRGSSRKGFLQKFFRRKSV